jgi:hypothetical protein
MKSNFFYSTLLLLFLVSCGDDLDSVNARVVNSSLSERVLRVNQSAILTLGLEYENSDGLIFDRSSDISLVVKIPAGLIYREGTAEIQRLIDDKKITPTIVSCNSSGEQFLNFRLDSDDLDEGRDPSGSADVEIKLTLDAIAVTGVSLVEAVADEDTPLFSCGSFFANDVQETIQVIP